MALLGALRFPLSSSPSPRIELRSENRRATTFSPISQRIELPSENRRATTFSPRAQRIELRSENRRASTFSPRAQASSHSKGNGRERRIWRRRKLTKKDEMLNIYVERVPFLEERVRKIREDGRQLTMDIEMLLMSEDNRYDFVNEIAAEANEYVENNRDEYGVTKKAVLHVLSNRVNDAGFYRPEAYAEPDEFKPGPGWVKEEFT